jgi:hypothetical protein
MWKESALMLKTWQILPTKKKNAQIARKDS